MREYGAEEAPRNAHGCSLLERKSTTKFNRAFYKVKKTLLCKIGYFYYLHKRDLLFIKYWIERNFTLF
jgi:hypothetical protein